MIVEWFAVMTMKDQMSSRMCMFFSVWGHSSSQGLFVSFFLSQLLVSPLAFFAFSSISFSSFSAFSFLSLKTQKRQVSPVRHMMALQQQGKLNSPVLHPTTVMMTMKMGRRMARQKFLILVVHLKRRKQGRLKKEVHCVSHICADRLSMVSTMLLTSLLTLSMAVFTVDTVLSCSQLTLISIWSTALAIVDWVTLMAVADVDFTVSTAEFMKEVACDCIWLRLFCVVETMELAVLLRVDSAEEIREDVVLDRAVAVPLMVLVVVVAADESEELTEEVTEEAALAISPSPNVLAGQRRRQRASRLIRMVFIPNQLVYSDQHRPIIYSPHGHHYPSTHLMLPEIYNGKTLEECFPSQATQNGYRKSSGRYASMTGGEGRLSTIELLTPTYSTKRVNCALLATASGFRTALVIWYCGLALVPIGRQQKTSCKFWLVADEAGEQSMFTQSSREEAELPMEPTISKACLRLFRISEELP